MRSFVTYMQRKCATLTTVATMDHQSTEDALRRRRERERERRARETPDQREARLCQHRLRDRERASQRRLRDMGRWHK